MAHIMVARPALSMERSAAHARRNDLHSVLLVLSLGAIMCASAWLIWGLAGVAAALACIATFALFGSRVPASAVMRMYGAKPMDPNYGAEFLRILEILSDRAELPNTPKLMVISSSTMNAFATGTKEHSAIAVTEGLLRRLDLREVTAVLAHEVSHISNNDLSTMALADTMSRITQLLSFVGVALALVNLPSLFTGGVVIPWGAVILLYLAPTLGNLAQMGLSRAREYDADLEGSQLTGDPDALISALQKIENYQGHFWEDMFFPGRKIPHPSLFRSHPPTDRRVKRLAELRATMPPVAVPDAPVITLQAAGPSSLFPHYRLPWPGIWY